MKRFIYLISITVGIAMIFGCVNVQVTEETEGEQMAKKILEDYDTLSNRWMVASLRNADEQTNLTSTEKKVIDAMNGRITDSDMVNEFKSAGYLGEGKNGFLKMKNPPDDSALKEKVEKIMKRENDNRKAIMSGVIDFDPELNKKHMSEVENTFAEKFAEESETGIWLENSDGSWRKKK